MRISSPLRYPGGKSVMAGLLQQIRKLNGFGSREIAEPFAGGSGASLTLLYLEETQKIHLNDADPAIFDFWWALTNRPKPFMHMLDEVRLDMDEWYQQRAIYRASARVSRLRRGFSAFYLNRCNRSGIIMNGGPIGGVNQKGKWKLDARFNKSELRRRCERIAEYRDRIHVSCRDGINFIQRLDSRDIFFFIDTPYFAKGKTLYLNALNAEYHAALAARLKLMRDAAWVLTYDDCPQIRRKYRGC